VTPSPAPVADYLTEACMINLNSEKSTPPNKSPIGGIKRPFSKDVIIAPK
jgi:hypothetical protein